jgi:hypothetical protein
LGPHGTRRAPAILRWEHIDDWLLHGPTFGKTSAALSAFTDLAICVGMLCHPKKAVPPNQVVKYCGYLYDTQEVPTLRIPANKRDRAPAMVQWVLSMEKKPLSRLALSVMIGVLQSLVSATPSNVGQTMLSRLYNLLHNTEDQDPQRKFYIRVTLNPEARHDLDWWKLALSLHVCHPVRPIYADAL